MSKPNKKRVKWLKKIAANPMRTTPLVPGRETDYIFEDDPKEKEAMILERHRRNSLAKLRKLDAQFEKAQEEYRRFRIVACERQIAADLKWLAEHKD